MSFDTEKQQIWEVLEATAPAIFMPYANLEEKHFPQIGIEELFRLRQIKKEYLQDLANSIQVELQIEMQTAFDAYGSGYASFVALFFYRQEDVIIENDRKEIEGILMYISIEVPAYIYAKHTLYDSNVLVLQSPKDDLEQPLDAYWQDKMNAIERLMKSLHFQHLPHDFLKSAPDFPCSLFTDIPYDGVFNPARKIRYFDLFFHWAS